MATRRIGSRKDKKPAEVDSMNGDMLAYLDDQEMTQVTNYIARGRAHQLKSPNELVEQWKDAFRAMAASPQLRELSKVTQDLQSELLIRKIPVPYDSVRDAMEAYTAAAEAALKEIKKDPEETERFGEDLLRDVNISKERRNRSKN